MFFVGLPTMTGRPRESAYPMGGATMVVMAMVVMAMVMMTMISRWFARHQLQRPPPPL
jgi:type II secretory pathway component PulK